MCLCGCCCCCCVWLCVAVCGRCRTLYSDRDANRNNELVCISKSDFGFSTTSGRPRDVYVDSKFSVDVKPGAIFADDGLLLIAEYAEPPDLDWDGALSLRQGPPEYVSGPALAKMEIPYAGGAPSVQETKEGPVADAVDQYTRERARMTQVPIEVDHSELAIQQLEVSDRHCNEDLEECGWAVEYELDEDTGYIDADEAEDDDSDDDENLYPMDGPGCLLPSQAFFIGEGVRGIAYASQLGRDYVIIQRCSMKASYFCRIEFHRIDDLSSDNDGQDDVEVGDESFTITILNPGLDAEPREEEVEEEEEGAAETPAPAKKDPKSQDKKARKGDTRKKRPKRKRKKRGKRRKKKTAAKKSKKKKKKKKEEEPKPWRAEEAEDDADLGDLGTISTAIAIPDGAVGMAYHLTNRENLLMFMFASAAEPYSRHMLWTGSDIDDSVHAMSLPAMASMPPEALENELFLKYKLKYRISPRCLIPIGEDCKDDEASAKDAKVTRGRRKKTKRRSRKRKKKTTRRLADQHDRDVEHDVTPMHPAAKAMHNFVHEQVGARPPWGDDEPSRGAVIDSTYRALGDPYAEDDATDGQYVVVACGDNILGDGNGDSDGRRQLVGGSRGAAYADLRKCIVTSVELMPETETVLVEYQTVLAIGPVPVTIAVDVALVWSINLDVTLCFADKTGILTLLPSAKLEVVLFGGFEIPYFARAGIEISVTLMDMDLIPELSLSFKTGMSICLALDIAFTPVSMRIDGVVSIYGCIKFCKVGSLPRPCVWRGWRLTVRPAWLRCCQQQKCRKVFGKKICVNLPCGLKFCKEVRHHMHRSVCSACH